MTDLFLEIINYTRSIMNNQIVREETEFASKYDLEKVVERLRNESGNYGIKTHNSQGEVIYYSPDPIVSWGNSKENAMRLPEDLAEIMVDYLDEVFPDDEHEIIKL